MKASRSKALSWLQVSAAQSAGQWTAAAVGAAEVELIGKLTALQEQVRGLSRRRWLTRDDGEEY